jgi:hypothetical protein
MVVPTDWVVTIVNPIDSIEKMYLEKSKSFPEENTLLFTENKNDGD